MMAAIRVEANRRAERRTAEHDFAAGGGIEPAEQVEQGRFTTTAVSANGNEFASVDGEIDTAKSLNSSFVVVLAQVAYFQNGASHAIPQFQLSAWHSHEL